MATVLENINNLLRPQALVIEAAGDEDDYHLVRTDNEVKASIRQFSSSELPAVLARLQHGLDVKPTTALRPRTMSSSSDRGYKTMAKSIQSAAGRVGKPTLHSSEASGRILSHERFGGLHHRYDQAA
jgi:hypothetical protein